MPAKFALLLVLAVFAAVPSLSLAAGEPYTVSVWARMLFGPDGKPLEYALVDEDKYPAAFAENVKRRLARASIQAPEVQGRPVTLRSGVEMRFTVTPSESGGTVKVDGITMGALPTRRHYADYPKDLAQTAGWEGDAVGSCTVTVAGRCKDISTPAVPVMPESVRRFVRNSLERWEFEPQQVDGVPIESTHEFRVRLNTIDTAIEDFREDRFQRLMKERGTTPMR